MSALHTYILYFCLMTLYEIICPISNGSVWVGITKNVELRFTQHMWGSNRDSEDKAAWCAELKRQKLVPILNVVQVDLSFLDAKRNERLMIIQRIKEGQKLFNINDRKIKVLRLIPR